MKKSIHSLVEQISLDNMNYISDNYDSIADYIIHNAENSDQGWKEYLSEDEITEYENDPIIASKLIKNVTNYLNENFNYKLEDI